MVDVKAYFCKLESINDDVYYLHSEWQTNGGVKLHLSDGEAGWNGTVTEEKFREFSRSLKVDNESFLEESRKALSRENVGGLTFQYEVETGDTASLVWKKYLPADKIKIHMGRVDLKPARNTKSVMVAMFEHCIGAQNAYSEKLSALESDNQRLVAERATALKRLEKYVTVKEDVEQDLYSKFVLIINEKKAKIRSLKEELAQAESGAESVQPSTSGTNMKSKHSSHDDANSDEENNGRVKTEIDSEYNTDEEMSASVSSPPVKRSRVVKKEVEELLADVMDEGDSPAKPAKRGRVRGKRGAKQTPAKPTMPKVPSGDTPQQSSKRGRPSLRKTPSDTSNVSNKSSDNLDDLVSQI